MQGYYKILSNYHKLTDFHGGEMPVKSSVYKILCQDVTVVVTRHLSPNVVISMHGLQWEDELR